LGKNFGRFLQEGFWAETVVLGCFLGWGIGLRALLSPGRLVPWELETGGFEAGGLGFLGGKLADSIISLQIKLENL
jgi:hypothetical protein